MQSDPKSSFLLLREKLQIVQCTIFNVSELDSIFILIGAWQVIQKGDGFVVIYWKSLTGAV